jgi:hypothetical protein
MSEKQIVKKTMSNDISGFEPSYSVYKEFVA